LVLAIFDIFGCHAGDRLVMGNLLVVGAKHGLAPFDVDMGLEIGANEGWFQQRADKSIMLTDEGFSALRGYGETRRRAIAV